MPGTTSRRTLRETLALLAAVAYPICGLGQDSVTLTFNWPADLSAQVSYTATRSRTVGDQSQELQMRGSYEINTEAVDDGLLVSFNNLEIDLPELSGDDPHTQLRAFMAKAGARIPDYVVDENGQILRVEGLEEMQSNVERALTEIAERLPAESRQPLQAMIRQTLTRDRLEAGVRENWNRDVASWNGATLQLGRLYETERDGKTAMLGDMDVPMKLTYRIRGRQRCFASAEEGSCVELEMRSFVDSEALAESFQAYMNSLGGGGAGSPKLRHLTIDDKVVLLAEPDTLIPHSMLAERTTSVAFSTSGVSRSTAQTERKSVVYRYP